MSAILMELQHVEFRDSDYFALRDISLQIAPGKVYQLTGTTASGKTTLLELMAGVSAPSSGSILWEGTAIRGFNRQLAASLGISLVQSNPCFYDHFSVAVNVLNTTLPRTPAWFRERELSAKCRDLFQLLGLSIDPDARVYTLTAGQKRILDLARVYAAGTKLLLIDAPADWADPAEQSQQAKILDAIYAKYRPAIVYCASRVDSTSRTRDGIIYLKDGQIASVVLGEDVQHHDIPPAFSRCTLQYPKLDIAPGKTLLELHRCGAPLHPALPDSLRLRAHEIVGFYGFDAAHRQMIYQLLGEGSGSTEFQLLVKGVPVKPQSPSHLSKLGIACQPMTKNDAIFGNLSLKLNLSPPNAKPRCSLYLHRQETFKALNLIKKAGIDAHDPEVLCGQLGNYTQQKVLLCRYLEQNASVFVLFYPTFGMENRAKLDIYNLLTHLQQKECGILLFSNDVDELIYMCDRIYFSAKQHECRTIAGSMPERANKMYQYLVHG